MKGSDGLNKCQQIEYSKLLRVDQLAPLGLEPVAADAETDALTIQHTF